MMAQLGQHFMFSHLFIVSTGICILQLSSIEEQQSGKACNVILPTHWTVLGFIYIHRGQHCFAFKENALDLVKFPEEIFHL